MISLSDELLERALADLAREELEKLPSNEELIFQYRIPKRFDRKILRIIHDEQRSPWMRGVVHYARRAAVFFLALLIAAGTTIMTVSATREWFFKVISEIFPTHTQIDYEPANSEQMELVFVPYAPTFLPDGYTVFDGPKIFSDTRRVTVRYENGNGGYISFSQTFSGGLNIDTEDAETELLQVSGYDAFYIRKGDWKSLNWDAGNARFLLSVDDSSLDKDDIVAIAESIAPVTINE